VLAGTFVSTPLGVCAIEDARVGDAVWSMENGQRVPSQIRAIYSTTVDEVLFIQGEGFAVCLTPNHPVATGYGEFRAAGLLAVNDQVVVAGSDGLVLGRISGIEPRRGGRAFDFSVMPGGTFIAGGLVVHNKGCFVPSTLVMAADGTRIPIQIVREGMQLRAFGPDESETVATVQEIFRFEVDGYWLLRTPVAELRVTGEHPIYTGSGVFRTVDRLRVGDVIYEGTRGGLRQTYVLGKEWVSESTCVYNLRTDAPHTYFAHGIAVHNKGGGGGGGRGFSSRRSSGFSSSRGGSGGGGLSAEESATVVWIIVTAYVGVAIFIWRSIRNRRNSNQCGLIPISRVKAKAERVRSLLAEITRSDSGMECSGLLAMARETFLKLQQCWTQQDYSEMASVMSEALFKEHLEKLRLQAFAGERNVLEQIIIREMEVIFVRHMVALERCQVAVLFEVSMVDYYARKESGAFLRGSRTPTTFQEVWWFARWGGGWKLDKIEQTDESSALEMKDVSEVQSR
jgi:hypothetical protein